MPVKLVVIYPRPKDIRAFETIYNRDHVTMVVERLASKTKLVATRVLGSPNGKPPLHRIAEPPRLVAHRSPATAMPIARAPSVAACRSHASCAADASLPRLIRWRLPPSRQSSESYPSG